MTFVVKNPRCGLNLHTVLTLYSFTCLKGLPKLSGLFFMKFSPNLHVLRDLWHPYGQDRGVCSVVL